MRPRIFGDQHGWGLTFGQLSVLRLLPRLPRGLDDATSLGISNLLRQLLWAPAQNCPWYRQRFEA